VRSEESQKGEENPRDRIIDPALGKTQIRLPLEGRNEKKIDQPPDAEKAEGQEIDRSGDGPTVVKPVGTGKSEDPQDIADRFQVCVIHIQETSFLSASSSCGGPVPHSTGNTRHCQAV